MIKRCLNCGSDYLNYWDDKIECCACGEIIILDENTQNKKVVGDNVKKSDSKDLSSLSNNTNGNKKK